MTLMIVVLAAIIVGAATVTWRQVSALRGRFSSVRIESFHIAEHLQAAVLTLNATLLRFVLRRERGDWESFTRDTEQLEGWLETGKNQGLRRLRIACFLHCWIPMR